MGVWNNFLLYFHTLRHLKWKQVYYRIWYALRRRFFSSEIQANLRVFPDAVRIQAMDFMNSRNSYKGPNRFEFLNISVDFKDNIDWNFMGRGKLWVYNLNYFAFLLQPSMTLEAGSAIMNEYATQYSNHKVGLEPYPTSLRIMNWIKFMVRHQVENDWLNQIVFIDTMRLRKSLEYHLMGNHLIENGFALLFSALYFNNSDVLSTAKKVLVTQLKEQVLSDGGHFELSPMYHQTILERVLDAYNLLLNNPRSELEDLRLTLEQKAQKMLGWLNKVSFTNGDIPLVNDSAPYIAPDTKDLNVYAEKLQIDYSIGSLSDSGYRKYTSETYEILMDIGRVGPDYIPGHGHADIFNFVLYWNKIPFIVDTGTSTYERGSVRNLERSTSAHNTVVVNKKNQSEVWASFRVARRAGVSIHHDDQELISATHDGYKGMGIFHKRTFRCTNHMVTITDELNKSAKAAAYFHFHPDLQLVLQDQAIVGKFGRMTFDGFTEMHIQPYDYAKDFNIRELGKTLVVNFDQQLTTFMEFNESAP